MEGRYCIILLPDETFGNVISSIRNNLKNITQLPSVPPHVTLREDFFSDNINGFIEEYTKEISDSKTLKLKIVNIEVFQRGHIVFLVQKNATLQRLHEKAVRISQKYVSTPKIVDFDCELNEEQKEMVKKYQLPFYFKYYTPHITIIRLNELEDKEHILKLVNKYEVPNEFEVSHVCVYDKLKHEVYRLIKL
ncbi:MAG: 2'-5' RNA ligase family protein [Nanoarchaeota archaeon]|nr:2'-5' RNA ligase family protein [Nanoarchaeota archaeon]